MNEQLSVTLNYNSFLQQELRNYGESFVMAVSVKYVTLLTAIKVDVTEKKSTGWYVSKRGVKQSKIQATMKKNYY
jgi:hypothetical protein